MKELVLSKLGHTWIIDLDGTLLKHNGYKIDGVDSFLPGAKEFMNGVSENDYVIIVTSREEKYRNETTNFLNSNHIRYNCIIFGVPYGERILLNDDKPSGLCMSHAIRLIRDEGINFKISEDGQL